MQQTQDMDKGGKRELWWLGNCEGLYGKDRILSWGHTQALAVKLLHMGDCCVWTCVIHELFKLNIMLKH